MGVTDGQTVDLEPMKACGFKRKEQVKIGRQQNTGHFLEKRDEAVARQEYNVKSTAGCLLAFTLGKEILQEGQEQSQGFPWEDAQGTP